MSNLNEMERAERLVREVAPPTPCELFGSVWLKREDLGPCGVFKWRGALAALTGGTGPVVAASSGNHGLGVAWAGERLGRPVEVFVPVGANPRKCARIETAGARIVESGRDLDEAIVAARARAKEGDCELLVDGVHPRIFAGTATIGLEIHLQLPEVARVVVPIGNGALVAGVASALRERGSTASIVGVGAEAAPFMYNSWRARRAVEAERHETIAEGLGGRIPMQPATDRMIELVDDFVLVSDDALKNAIARFHRETGDVIEPAAAASLAALEILPAEPSPTVALVTGRNISAELQEELFGGRRR
jgi:threonine dehydratase